MKIAVTGHRPKDIGWGYDYNAPKWQELKNKMKEFLRDQECEEAICGMALGVDTVYALAVLELKAEGMNIRLIAAVPCYGQARQWPEVSQKLYYNILMQADEIHVINGTESTIITADTFHLLKDSSNYTSQCMLDRNIWMIVRCSMLLAVWSGKTTGGTAHAVHSAIARKKEFKVIAPSDIKGKVG
jgi:uncharacterized phage-like protein YoqJ